LTRHLLVIGAQRCGTTYLASLLDAHPEITMARPAKPEPKVFLSPYAPERGLEWYRSTYFGHATTERVLGEKSTSYLEHPEAAARAASVLTAPAVVVQLRDPVARAVSNWRFSTAHGWEERPLVQALEENLEAARPWDPAEVSVSPYAYLERGRYVDYLDPWLDRFPADVHVLFLEHLTARPETIGALYAALGVDAAFRPPVADRVVNQSEGPPPPLPEALHDRLRDYFRASDAVLEQRLGMQLPWSEPSRSVSTSEGGRQ